MIQSSYHTNLFNQVGQTNTKNNYVPTYMQARGLGQQTKEDQLAFKGFAEYAAKKVPQKMLASPFFHSVLKLAEKNASLFEAAFVLLIAGVARPATIMSIPGAKREDKEYAAVKAVATALVGFSLAAILYMPMANIISRLGHSARYAGKAKEALDLAKAAVSDPEKIKFSKQAAEKIIEATRYMNPDKTMTIFDKAVKALLATGPKGSYKIAEHTLGELNKIAKFPYAVGTKAFDSYNYLLNYGSKVIVGPIDAWILFKLIPPIMHKLFPERAKKNKFDPPPTFAKPINNNEQRALLQQFQQKVAMKGGN